MRTQPKKSDTDDEAHEEAYISEDEDAEARAEEEALRYTFSSKNALMAKKYAARMSLDIFKRAASTFHMTLTALRTREEEPRVALTSSILMSPGYTAFAHQIVAVTELYIDAFRPKRGGILADEMGSGETHTVLATFWMNMLAVAQIHSGIPNLEFPPMSSGAVNGVPPRVGATFISASPQGLKVWPQA